MTVSKRKIIIAGAGAIGNYIGVQLRKSHHEVIFLGSTRVTSAVKQQGLIIEYPHRPPEFLGPDEITLTDDPACCKGADLIIITIKCTASATLANQIKPHLSPSTRILTLQNGVHNAAYLSSIWPHHAVVSGMVTFNVVEKKSHLFCLTTPGEIYLQKVSPSLLPIFEGCGLIVKEDTQIEGMLWSKLLLNLVNPLNALSGVSLKQNLEDRPFRLQWAACMREGLNVLRAAGITPAKVTPLPPRMLPAVVSLPNFIYLKLAASMKEMDPTATTSMAQDLKKGNPTEIDFLSGELIRLGEKFGIPTPINRQIYASIKSAEDPK